MNIVNKNNIVRDKSLLISYYEIQTLNLKKILRW